jgi:hypothetical protein
MFENISLSNPLRGVGGMILVWLKCPGLPRMTLKAMDEEDTLIC